MFIGRETELQFLNDKYKERTAYSSLWQAACRENGNAA